MLFNVNELTKTKEHLITNFKTARAQGSSCYLNQLTLRNVFCKFTYGVITLKINKLNEVFSSFHFNCEWSALIWKLFPDSL